MEDSNKEEYVYLMIVHTQDTSGRAVNYNVNPFKTANDVKYAILNVIANNIKNYKHDIAYISYDYECARIGYKNGVSKTYNVIRRRIEEVK